MIVLIQIMIFVALFGKKNPFDNINWAVSFDDASTTSTTRHKLHNGDCYFSLCNISWVLNLF